MNILYGDTFSLGWKRMKKILFAKPFDLNKWFIMGFSAFLANLLGGSLNYGRFSKEYKGKIDLISFRDEVRDGYTWLLDHPQWLGLIIAAVFFVLALLVLFTWLSSRGKFMFLDNVVRNKAEISHPWNTYKEEGNSLFLWRLGFGAIFLGVLILYALLMLYVVMQSSDDLHPLGLLPRVFTGVLGYLLIFIVMLYIRLFLNDFIVPVMYRDRIHTTAAWRKFMPILKKHFWYFVLYGLFVFVLGIVVVIGIVILALMTCCVGLILLVIPYLNSVFLLPVSTTFRSFSVYFLEQFGPDFRIFPEKDELMQPVTAGEGQ